MQAFVSGFSLNMMSGRVFHIMCSINLFFYVCCHVILLHMIKMVYSSLFGPKNNLSHTFLIQIDPYTNMTLDISCQQMHKINGDKAQMLTDSSKSYGDSMLSRQVQLPSQGRSLAVPLHALGGAASIKAWAEQTLNALCAFHLFCKTENHVQISFGQQKQVLRQIHKHEAA